MPRERYAVALLVPEPVATEIDGLRRALGDRGLANVVPHITLVPPVNVASDRAAEVLAQLRRAAASSAPLRLRLGPVTTFSPVTPVLYLAVDGDLDELRVLREALFAGPLGRKVEHPFVPHVTISEECDSEAIDAARAVLAGYTADVEVDRVHLLRDRAPGPRRWNAVADAWFEPPLVVGRGGRELEITVSSLADPEVAPRFADPFESCPSGADAVVAVARHDGAMVAAARGWARDGDVRFRETTGDPEAERLLLKAAAGSRAARVGRQPNSTEL